MWRSSAALIAAGSVLALCACTATPQQPSAVPEVRVGLLGTLTGPGGGTGQEAAHGAELAALVVNQTVPAPVPLAGAGLPGLGGARVRIVQANSHGDPQQAVTQAIRLATERHVAGIISVDPATATALASERTERIGVPFIGAVATADFLTERGLDWFFRVTPTDSMLAQAGLAMLGQTGGSAVRRLGILQPDDETSNEVVTALRALAAQAGDEVASTATFASGSGAGEVRPGLERVRGANPDAVIAVAARPDDAAALLAADTPAGGRRPVSLAMGAGFSPRTIRRALQSTTTELLRSTAWSRDFAERNLAANAIADLFQRRFRTPMTEAAAETFTATLTLAQAIDAAGSVDAHRVRTALLGLDVPGRETIMPWGGIRFDQTGENTLAAGLVERVTRDSGRVVFPRELAVAGT